MADNVNPDIYNVEANNNEIIWKSRKRLWCGLPWTFTVYRMSRDRLFLKRGVFNIREDEVRLYRIRDVALRRTFAQRLFGLGTVTVASSDANLGVFEMKNIKDAKTVKEQLSELVEMERQRKRVTSREFLVGGDSLDGEHDDIEDDNDRF